MAGKSFKDYYVEDKVVPEPARKSKNITEQGTVSAKVEEIVLTPTPKKSAVSEDITTAVKDLILEQRQQTGAILSQNESLLESVTKTNSELTEKVKTLVESTTEVNNKLLEAIVALTEKVAMLEGKLDEIKHLEIPTPIVNLQMPSKKTLKTVHRDKRGIITHIEESEQFDEPEGE